MLRYSYTMIRRQSKTILLTFHLVLIVMGLSCSPVSAGRSSYRTYLELYQSVPDDQLRLRQERLVSLIAFLKTTDRKRLKPAPDLSGLYHELWRIQVLRGDGKGALATCNDAIENGDNLDEFKSEQTKNLFRKDRCQAYLVLRQPDEALDELETYRRKSARQLDPGYYGCSEAHEDYLESWARFLKGESQRALELSERIVTKASMELCLEVSPARILRSKIYSCQGNFSKALDEANKTLRFPADTAYQYTQEKARALVVRAVAQNGLGRFDQSISDAQEAIKINPEIAEAYWALAMALKSKQKREEAVTANDKALSLDSDLAEAQALRAELNKPVAEAPPQVSSSRPAAEDRPAPVKTPIRDKWALVIGISKFQNEALNLKFADKDARDFRDYLIEEGNFAPDHVKLLLNGEATREAILGALGDDWLPRLVLPDDLVVIYLSTHGSPASYDVKGVNYLVAHDTKVDSLYATGIALQDLVRIIKARISTNRIVMILDACYSGSAEVTGGKGVLRVGNVDTSALAQGTGQIVIASSDIDQRSWEFKDKPNGVFTYYLLESLRLAGEKTELMEAFNIMKEKVQQQVLRERGELQVPVLRSKWSGDDLKLAAPPSKPRKSVSDDQQ